jgi:1-acyl-sn-glycerol-3-phosphate acyltransferase
MDLINSNVMFFSRLVLKWMGWKLEGVIPSEKKFVVVSVPHTSNWDFIIGRMFLYQIRLKPHFLVKKELFFFPLGFFMRKMGGIPVDRNKKSDTIQKLVKIFNTSENFVLAITPEGTRKNVTEWKTGFYYIAKGAQVPILPTYFDFKRKIIGVGDPFYAGDSVENDMKKIKEFVKEVVPKHPKFYTPWQE